MNQQNGNFLASTETNGLGFRLYKRINRAEFSSIKRNERTAPELAYQSVDQVAEKISSKLVTKAVVVRAPPEWQRRTNGPNYAAALALSTRLQ